VKKPMILVLGNDAISRFPLSFSATCPCVLHKKRTVTQRGRLISRQTL
jgi:hypothetical protein